MEIDSIGGSPVGLSLSLRGRFLFEAFTNGVHGFCSWGLLSVSVYKKFNAKTFF